MKLFIPNKKRMRQTLASECGATLFEALVAILIFSVLMVTVASIIVYCLKITDVATKMASSIQGETNAALLGASADPEIEVTTTINEKVSFILENHSGAQVEVNVTVNKSAPESSDQERAFVAFQPG